MAQRLDASSNPVGDATSLIGTAVAKLADNETTALFTDTSSAASGSVNAKANKYVINIIKNSANTRSAEKEHKFEHGASDITVQIVSPVGSKGPFTMVLLNTATGDINTIESTDGNLIIPNAQPYGNYILGVRDSENKNSAYIASFTVPAANAATNGITLTAGSLLSGTVLDENSAKVAGATIKAPKHSNNAQDIVSTNSYGANGAYVLANVKSNAYVNIMANKADASGVIGVNTPVINMVDIVISAATITVVGGPVTQIAAPADVPAVGTKVTITAPDGGKYIGYVDQNGIFAVPGVKPTEGGNGFKVHFEDSRGQHADENNVTVTPNNPKDGFATTDITFPKAMIPPFV
ncbi:MAG: hypothetical protein RSC01_10850, partial [Oscillospiraceae bacterium]